MFFISISIAIAIASLSLGLFMALRPSATIEFQRRFYEKINWRIEPVSMRKEVRNTRIMGVFLIAAALFMLIKAFLF